MRGATDIPALRDTSTRRVAELGSFPTSTHENWDPNDHVRPRSSSHACGDHHAPSAGFLFSGMGGFATGFRAAGFHLSWANDADASAAATFQHRFPGVSFYNRDVCELSVEGDSVAPVDVLAAGFPCQSFSQAGTRRGFDDPRGRLFFEIPRFITEFARPHRPKLIVLENVPNLLRGARYHWFDQIQRTLRRSGYWFRRESCWVVNVKDATPIPQDRERLFMVAASRDCFSRNPFRPPSVETASLAMSHRLGLHAIIDRTKRAPDEEYLPEDNRYFKMISAAMRKGDADTNIFQLRRSYVRERKDGVCPTLTANMGIGGHNVPFVRDQWGIRRLSVHEVSRLQGFDDDDDLFPDIPVQHKYRLLGNAVCALLARIVAGACATTLTETPSSKKTAR